MANTMVVIILQFINISNLHIIHLKFTMLCKLYLNKAGKSVQLSILNTFKET